MSKFEALWEDREIRFDVRKEHLSLREGEKLVQNHSKVEDTKGNGGKWGELLITNLRIIWQNNENSKINLSIGLSTITGISTKMVSSKIVGTSVSICLSTRSNSNRFEFIFTDASSKSTAEIYSTISSITKAYDSSRLFRDLKLRGALVHNGQIRLLPTEEIYNKINGVWNLSSEQGNLGSFYITNIRVVWFANMNESYNVSLPYLQISSIKVRDSKFGVALVIESSWQSGGFVLGFRIDPVEKVRKVAKEIATQHHKFMASPAFGVQFTLEPDDERDRNEERRSRQHASTSQPATSSSVLNEDVEIDATLKSDACVLYFANGQQQEEHEISSCADKQPIFSRELGIAIEPLKSGTTIESLWKLF